MLMHVKFVTHCQNKHKAEANKLHMDQVKTLRGEMERMLSEARKAFDCDVSRLECELNATKCELTATQCELKEARAAGEKSAQLIEQRGEEIHELTEQHAHEVACFHSELASLAQQISRVGAELNVSRAESLVLAATGKSASEEVAEHRREIAMLNEKLELEGSRLGLDLTDVKRELARVAAEMNDSQAEVKSLLQMRVAMADELEGAIRQIACLGAELNASRTEATLMQEKLALTEAVLSNQKASIKMMEAHVQETGRYAQQARSPTGTHMQPTNDKGRRKGLVGCIEIKSPRPRCLVVRRRPKVVSGKALYSTEFIQC